MNVIRNYLLIALFALCSAIHVFGQGYIRAYDFDGRLGQIKSLRGTPDGGLVFVVSLSVDSVNSENTAMLVRANASGDTLWTRNLYTGTKSISVLNVETGPSGEFYVMTGLGTASFGNSAEGNISRFTGAGQLEWLVPATGINMEITTNGLWVFKAVNSGFQSQKFDFQGNAGPFFSYSNIDIVNYWDAVGLNNGGACAMVTYNGLGANFNDMQLISINNEGIQQWQQTYNELGYEFNGKIIQDSDGSLVYTDYHSYNVELAKIGVNGNTIWRHNFSDLPDYDARGLCETDDNGYIVFGSFAGSGPLNGKHFVFKTDENGELLWLNVFPQNNVLVSGIDVIPMPGGGAMIAGSVKFDNIWLPCLIRIDANGNYLPAQIIGKVNFDQDHDCSLDPLEPPLANWVVSATGIDGFTSYATTDTLGNYRINVDTSTYTVQIHPPGVLWEPCDDGQYIANLDNGPASDTAYVNFAVKDSILCSLLDVSIGTPRLRRCFTNIYTVSWCNRGTATAFDALIEVVLPPELDFVFSQHPVIQSGDTLKFEVGTVDFGECGQLSFEAEVNCDSSVIGQTLCVEAHITPDTLCYEVASWSGARITARADCLGDTAVELRLKNVGSVPSSLLDYIITEDLVVLMQGNFELDPGEEEVITRVANSTTQRIEAEQEPGYPFPSVPSAAVEGCGVAPFSFGFINQFDLDDGSPFTDIDCREVVGSYDPNDKQGFPVGYGNEHFIKPHTDLNYLIRFQNTGTDTAFTVVVRDTLSKWLDPASVRPGAASHPFTWSLEENGILVFHFDNILLPDSNVNEAASHGFVQFGVSQQPDVALGAAIENTAAIYFDFNAPVITNTTLHTVGENFYIVSVDEVPGGNLFPVEISPNPFREQTTMRLPDAAPADALFRLYDQAGKLMRSEAFSGRTLQFSAGNMPSGFYWFEIRGTNGQTVGSGKMIRN
ncbi:MAG: hypothetical protein H6575_13245 [Lewinellaceae bacterium]|nr:hypothetical protein [Lewinellaceae bacterium]